MQKVLLRTIFNLESKGVAGHLTQKESYSSIYSEQKFRSNSNDELSLLEILTFFKYLLFSLLSRRKSETDRILMITLKIQTDFPKNDKVEED